MKKYIYYFLGLMFVLSACSKDETLVKVMTNPVAAGITTPTAGSSTTITVDNQNTLLFFQWSKADYGVATQISYTLQMDTTGNAFATAVSLSTTVNDSVSVSYSTLNDKLLNTISVPPNVASTLDLRVLASINGKDTVISPVVSIKITPYKSVVDKLWVPGGYQNWLPASAPVIRVTTTNTFEGYVYFNAGTGFKFTNAPDWDHTNYGDSGTYGVFTTDGAAPSLGVSTGGVYYFIVNTDALTYQETLINTWGVIGTATPHMWDSSTPMTYDAPSDTWKITLDLVPGALKFRANDDWGLNYGPADVNSYDGTLIHTDDSITITDAGNYTVTMDMTRSAGPAYNYVYTVVKN